MTDLSRGARVRRGGRRPGWLLLTALLVLAIGASSALVFTNRVELLKLAVILALWAAVVAAFVSVIYRRQSDVDQARARDLKLVYDLQLDREISARREYELTVESQLRRELASELRAHATDEVSALRAELATLRTNLEILFDAELSERPALETERRTVNGYSDWDRENETARERINRVTSVRAEEPSAEFDDSIIDVPEEPLIPSPVQSAADSHQRAYAYQSVETDRGAHRLQADRAAQDEPEQATPPTGWAMPVDLRTSEAPRRLQGRRRANPDHAPQTGEWAGSEVSSASSAEHQEPQPLQRSPRRHEAPPQPEPEPPPEQHRTWPPPPAEPSSHRDPLPGWQPVSSEEQWLQARAPGDRIPDSRDNGGAGPWVYDNAPSRDSTSPSTHSLGETPTAAPSAYRRGRHSNATEPGGPRAQARHSSENTVIEADASPAPAMSSAPPPAPPPPPSEPPERGPVMSPPPSAPAPLARHRSTDPDNDGPPSGGQSVAELLARLQTSPSGGGRRRRRED
ncbi:MAG: hypothetical protein JO259_12660 [Mycobacterium sp.]|nr:hypothetical protein [Mycobacterium sp.]